MRPTGRPVLATPLEEDLGMVKMKADGTNHPTVLGRFARIPRLMKDSMRAPSVTTLFEMAVICLAPLLLGSNGGGCSSEGTPFASGADAGVDSVEDAPGSADAAVVRLADAAVEDAPDIPCTVTVSGGLTASHVCTGAVFQHFVSMNTSNVNFAFQGGGVTISADVIFSGDLRVGTFLFTDPGTTGGVQVSQSQPPPGIAWISDAAEFGHGTEGSWTLHITSAIRLSTVGNNENYALHGTMSSTLPPDNPVDPMNPPADVTFFGEF
jgi:hypothetical protein